MFDRPTTSSADRTRRRRLTSDERRAQILAAARTEFARVGYHGTSTAGIARAASCSEPMLYKHFPSKLALYCEVLRSTISQATERYLEHVDLEGDLVTSMVEYANRVMRDPAYQEMVQLRLLSLGLLSEAEVLEVATEVDELVNQNVALAMQHGHRNGSIRADAAPEYVISAWNGLLFAAAWRSGLHPNGFEEVIPHVVHFLEQLRPTAAEPI